MEASNDKNIYKCTVAAPWAIGVGGVLCCIIALIAGAIFFADADISVKGPVLGFIMVYLIFLIGILLRDASTILKITETEVCLSRFGTTILKFNLSDVNAVGIFAPYHRNTCLYIAVLPEEDGTVADGIRNRAKKVNKKNSKMICVERTPQRIKAFQELIPVALTYC